MFSQDTLDELSPASDERTLRINQCTLEPRKLISVKARCERLKVAPDLPRVA